MKKLFIFILMVLLLSGCNEVKSTQSGLDSKSVIKTTSTQYNENISNQDLVIITNIKEWNHPTKDVFKKYNLQLIKVELTNNKTYPTFYLFGNNELEQNVAFIYDLAQNNGYWDFKIVDNKGFIKVNCDKDKKTVKSIETPKETIKLDKPNTNGNLNNDGYAVQYRNKIIFSPQYNNGIFMINLDGTQIKKLSDQLANFMNVKDNYLYYSDYDSIQRLNIVDKKTETIYQESKERNISWLSIYGNDVLFYDGKLKMIDLTNENSIKVLMDGPMYSINRGQNKLYYIKRDSVTHLSSIYTVDLSSKKEKLIKDKIEDLYSMNFYNNRIYYITRPENPQKRYANKSLIKTIDVDGNNNSVVREFNENMHSMNIVNDWIYYVRGDEDNYEVIARLNIKNPSIEEVLPLKATYSLYENSWEKKETTIDSPMSLNIIDHWIFFENTYGHNSSFEALYLSNY